MSRRPTHRAVGEVTPNDSEDYRALAANYAQLKLRMSRLEKAYAELEGMYGEKCMEVNKVLDRLEAKEANGDPESGDSDDVDETYQSFDSVPSNAAPPHVVSAPPHRLPVQVGVGPSTIVTQSPNTLSKPDVAVPPGWMRCDLCNIVVSGDELWRAHVAGKKHIREVNRAQARQFGGMLF